MHQCPFRRSNTIGDHAVETRRGWRWRRYSCVCRSVFVLTSVLDSLRMRMLSLLCLIRPTCTRAPFRRPNHLGDHAAGTHRVVLGVRVWENVFVLISVLASLLMIKLSVLSDQATTTCTNAPLRRSNTIGDHAVETRRGWRWRRYSCVCVEACSC